MLHAPLTDVGVLLLASQCWDRDLIARVHGRLAGAGEEQAGLPRGAIVVDYSDALTHSRPRDFRLLSTVTVPVSWNNRQTMAVMLRVEQSS